MESTTYEGRTSLKNYPARVFVGGVLLLLSALIAIESMSDALVPTLMGLAAIGSAYINVIASQYKVTSERVIQQDGLVSRRTSEVELGDIRNVQVIQSATQRILGVGDVAVASAGQSELEIVFTGIANPQPVADLIREQRKSEG